MLQSESGAGVSVSLLNSHIWIFLLKVIFFSNVKKKKKIEFKGKTKHGQNIRKQLLPETED